MSPPLIPATSAGLFLKVETIVTMPSFISTVIPNPVYDPEVLCLNAAYSSGSQ